MADRVCRIALQWVIEQETWIVDVEVRCQHHRNRWPPYAHAVDSTEPHIGVSQEVRALMTSTPSPATHSISAYLHAALKGAVALLIFRGGLIRLRHGQ